MIMDKDFQRNKRPAKVRRYKSAHNRSAKTIHFEKSISSAELQYIALYKPFGVLSQFTGEDGQRTLGELGLQKVYTRQVVLIKIAKGYCC